MRALYLSEPLPSPTASGALILHRHLEALSTKVEVAVAHPEKPDLPARHFPLRLRRRAHWLARLQRGRRYLNALEDIMGWRYGDAQIDSIIQEWRPDLLVTVAQGGLCHNARRAAARHRRPLVSFYHDWSPDWRDHPRSLKPALTRAFRRVYRQSRIALCISPALKAALGVHPDARILYPIPGGAPNLISGQSVRSQTITYAGVLNGLYQDEIFRLAEHLKTRPADQLDLAFYGPNPYWSEGIGREFLGSKYYRGFLPPDEFRVCLAASSVLLVIMPFSAKHRRFAELSFPSKLTEYTGMGRPIVVWAPSYSSAAKWSNETGAALVVANEDPAALLTSLSQLERDAQKKAALAECAQRQFVDHFSPAVLQAQFESAVFESTTPLPR